MFTEYRSTQYPAFSYQLLLGIYPVWLGHLTAAENYECKPRILDNFFINFVSSGKGYFSSMGRDYELEKNDAYFLFPGVVHSYKTDVKDHMDIWWVGFNGSNVAKFLKEININPNNPIIKNIKNPDLLTIIKDIVNYPNDVYLSDFIKQSGNLYKMIGTLMEICSPNVFITPDYQFAYSEPVMRALTFMNSNYPQPISINLVASHAGLSRAYFAITFKDEVGCSPSEYLANLRYQNAKRYLSDTKLSITEVAHSVGFDDALYFSKFFRKFEKMSPSEYRNKKKCL